MSSEDGLVAAFDARAGAAPLFRLSAHDKPTCAMSFCAAAPGLLATGSTDKKVRAWAWAWGVRVGLGAAVGAGAVGLGWLVAWAGPMPGVGVVVAQLDAGSGDESVARNNKG